MTAAGEKIVSAARELAPTIRSRAAEIEHARRLPLDLVAELKRAGFFRMLLPGSHGGLEADYPSTVDALVELSAADGATGWTVMIGSESPQLLALLPKKTFEEVYAAGPDVIIAGAFAPQGRAVRADGGYRVTGRWGFASGCQHADWLFANCAVVDPAAPAPDPAAPPSLLCMLSRQSDWTIHDTWKTSGLRGTGSHDIEARELFVPTERSFLLFGGEPTVPGPLFQAPILQASLHIGAVALGIAEGALADLVELAGTKKKRLYAQTSLVDSAVFQNKLGHVHAELLAARALLRERAEELWARMRAGNVEPTFMTRVVETTAWVAETAASAVDACYTGGGGSALYESSPLQRRLRDIHTLTQHASVQDTVFTTAGALLLGQPARFGL